MAQERVHNVLEHKMLCNHAFFQVVLVLLVFTVTLATVKTASPVRQMDVYPAQIN
jgi:hypothetical protein